jgi:histidyl-tRNA synthetase
MDRDSSVFNYAINIVRDLRSNGISVSWDLMKRSYQKQREYARKLSVPVILYIGKAEVESGKVTIYITTSGERREIERDMLAKTLKEIL